MSLATVLYTRRDNPESPFLYDNEKLARSIACKGHSFNHAFSREGVFKMRPRLSRLLSIESVAPASTLNALAMAPAELEAQEIATEQRTNSANINRRVCRRCDAARTNARAAKAE